MQLALKNSERAERLGLRPSVSNHAYGKQIFQKKNITKNLSASSLLNIQNNAIKERSRQADINPNPSLINRMSRR